MTYRGISAIVFAILVTVEIAFFLAQPTPTTFNKNSTSRWDATITDNVAQSNLNTKFAVILGATILVGGIVIFAIPNTKLSSTGNSRKNEEA